MELWQTQSDAPLPHVVVRMPKGGPIVWQGPLAHLESERLLDSPARREIVRRLLAGHSAVWVLIGPKDAKPTADARKLLTDKLTVLQDEIPLPAGVGLPGSELLSKIPLAVKFSFVEVDPADPAEAYLLRMLSSQGKQPMESADLQLTAVFGRGRAADVFSGEDLGEDLLSDVSQFLCGACSYQVKQLNPGFDLLLATHWEQKLFEGEPAPAESQPIVAEDAPPVTVPIPPGLPEKLERQDLPDTAAPLVSQASIQPGPKSRGTIIWTLIGAGLFAFVWAVVSTGKSK
jgi:hypothetical protein